MPATAFQCAMTLRRCIRENKATPLLLINIVSCQLAVHPRQIEPIQRAFRPSEAMIAWAQTVAAAAASGAAIQLDGQMVDRQ
jgi:hypothetical protein